MAKKGNFESSIGKLLGTFKNVHGEEFFVYDHDGHYYFNGDDTDGDVEIMLGHGAIMWGKKLPMDFILSEYETACILELILPAIKEEYIKSHSDMFAKKAV